MNDDLNYDAKGKIPFPKISFDFEYSNDLDELEKIISKLTKMSSSNIKNSLNSSSAKLPGLFDKVYSPMSTNFKLEDTVFPNSPQLNPSDLSLDQKILRIIQNDISSTNSSVSCRYFTSPLSVNKASNYPYANGASTLVCTNPSFLSSGSKHVSCGHFPALSNCIGFSPDYILISSTEIDGADHYLIRYRSIDGSTAYLFADSSLTTYNRIVYQSDISLVDDNLDSEVLALFAHHLSNLTISSHSPSLISSTEESVSKVSYFTYITE